jgi:hypothetical protein
MLNVFRPSCVCSFLFCLFATLGATTALAQYDESTMPPGLSNQLNRLDLAVSGVGIFNNSSTGTAVVNGVPTTVSISPGDTLGALVTLRYIVKPLVGLEFNFGYSRYTNTFSPFGAQTTGGVQQNAREYTLGYVAHTPHPYFGVTPFLAVGAGTTAFRPTTYGGESLLEQARATYYYAVGAETTIGSPHFGVRGQFRQAFFLAPDYGQNYLTILKHTSTFEPGFGFFVRF